MFRSVLIANRGEIAVRVIQTCREMGIRTVAVFSEADAMALHVLLADEAYCVGPAPALDSYLNVDAILRAVRDSRVEAVHPGYGFLAENPGFARRVVETGAAWIGPRAEVVALMGDKAAAKALAQDAGVPTVPGYLGEEQTVERLSREAQRIGFPIMIKAVAGGGGKGMRAVSDPASLPSEIESAKREARSAFGDDRVFLERLLPRPRHVEIQILADGHGNVVSLGERDCSIQRRHQKVVEESPSPVLSPDLRRRMSEAAVRLARAGEYTSTGTVEFLFDSDAFYFLEMNTRIQVEHPVTEMVLGLDLVRLQIEIAAGGILPFGQLDVKPRGHAVEARIYAEDPETGFLPATGRLTAFQPPSGPGIRNDVGVSDGSDVLPYYDPILAKLVAYGANREEAIQRLSAALERYVALGVTTNIPFLRWVCSHPVFVTGRADIGFVDSHWEAGERAGPPDLVLTAAALYSALQAHTINSSPEPLPGPWQRHGGWRLSGSERPFRFQWDGGEAQVSLRQTGQFSWTSMVDDRLTDVRHAEIGPGQLVLATAAGSDVFYVAASAGSTSVSWRGETYTMTEPESGATDATGHPQTASGIAAPMPGTVVHVAVSPGQRVAAHEALVVLEAMKMEHVIEAPHAGVVEEVLYGVGDLVPAGAAVVRLEAT